MSFDLVIRNATLPDGRRGIDIAVRNGRIEAVEPGVDGEAGEVVDAGGQLVSPPFVDIHFHMDATLSLGIPRLNRSGTLLEGIQLWGELKPLLTREAVVERALRYCDLAVSQGLLAVRSHVDVCDDRLVGVEALLEVKDAVGGEPVACAGHGRRRRRRHPAFRADHGGRHTLGHAALRDRRGAGPDGGPALRRDG